MRFQLLTGLWAAVVLVMVWAPGAHADPSLNAWNELIMDQNKLGFITPFVSSIARVSVWVCLYGSWAYGRKSRLQGYKYRQWRELRKMAPDRCTKLRKFDLVTISDLPINLEITPPQNMSRAVAATHLAQWRTIESILAAQNPPLTPHSPNLPISTLLPALRSGIAAAAKTILLNPTMMSPSASTAVNALYDSQVVVSQTAAIAAGVLEAQAIITMRSDDGYNGMLPYPGACPFPCP